MHVTATSYVSVSSLNQSINQTTLLALNLDPKSKQQLQLITNSHVSSMSTRNSSPHSITPNILSHSRAVTHFSSSIKRPFYPSLFPRITNHSLFTFSLAIRVFLQYDTVFRRTLCLSENDDGDGESLQRKRRIQRFFKHLSLNSCIIVMAWIHSLQHRNNPLRFTLPSSLQISLVRSLSLSHYYYPFFLFS